MTGGARRRSRRELLRLQLGNGKVGGGTDTAWEDTADRQKRVTLPSPARCILTEFAIEILPGELKR